MGKGDKRSKRGKRIMGTYGNSRKRKVSTPILVTKKKQASSETAEKKTTKKSTTKKTTASKSKEAKEK